MPAAAPPPGDVNAAAEAEIVRLRAENARLGADNAQLRAADARLAADNAQLAVIAHGELADLRSIERRVKLDDRPWSGKWCLRFEAIVLVYFVLMAVLMAATGAPKYETNSNHEIEGVHPWYEDDAKACCDKAAAGAPGTWGAWLKSEMCWEMEAAGQWDPPPFTGQCTAPTACLADGSPCAADEFCDFTSGSVGQCQPCSGYDSSKACYLSWLPSDGAEDCHACCFPATRRRLAKKKHTPRPQTVWEGFSLHPGIPLGVIAVIMFLCAGFLKLMEKFAKTVLFGTFLAEAVFCLYLGFAGKFEAGRAVVWTIIALAIGIYVAVMHKKIAKAGDCISVASTALLSMPSLMATVYGWMVASAVLVFVLIGVAMASGKHWRVRERSARAWERGDWPEYTTCNWEYHGGWYLVTWILIVIWKWMWYFLVMTQVYFVSGCVAQYNFDRSLVTKAMPLTLIKLAFTKSAGTVGKSALILQFITWVKKKTKINGKNCCCLINPFHWPVLLVAAILRCCCITCLKMVNKFALIFHVITGDEFWLSAKRCYKLMKHAGLDALVMETAAMNSFVIIGYGLSVCVGVFTWWWAGVEYGKDVLGNEDIWGEKDEYARGSDIWMLVVMMILLLWPAFALFLVVIIALAAGTAIIRCWIPWCCGVFCGAVCSFFFWQTVNALLVASNATFVCIAIDKVNGAAAFVDNALYRQAQADITEFAKAEAVGSARVGAGPTATAVAAQGPVVAVAPQPRTISPQSVVAVAPQPRTISMQIPPDAAPGTFLVLPLPDGRTVQVAVPPDAAPGAVVQVTVPP